MKVRPSLVVLCVLVVFCTMQVACIRVNSTDDASNQVSLRQTNESLDENREPPSPPKTVQRRLFQSDVIDLGKRNATVAGATPMRLSLWNRTKEAIRIVKVDQSCGCLKVDLPKTELPPDTSGDALFTLSLAQPGRQTATIRLHCSNASKDEWIEEVQLEWEVVTGLTVSPDIIIVDDIPSGGTLEATFSWSLDDSITDLKVDADPLLGKLVSYKLNVDAENNKVVVEGTVPEDDRELVLPIAFRFRDSLLAMSKVIVRPWRPVRFSPSEIYLSLNKAGQPVRRRCVVAIDPSSVELDELEFEFLPQEAEDGLAVTIHEQRRRGQVIELEIEFNRSVELSGVKVGRIVATKKGENLAHVPIRIRANSEE